MKKKQDELKEVIYLLKRKQAIELKLFKEQVQIVHESIKPINIIKNAFHQALSSPDIKGNMIDNGIGMLSGYISKKAFVAGSHNPVTKIIGSLLQLYVTNIASKNADSIKSISETLIQFVFKKSENDTFKNSIENN